MILEPVEESDEQKRGFKKGFVMVVGLGGKSCRNIGTKVLCGMRSNTHLGWDLLKELLCIMKNPGIVWTYGL
jgi:hypothetical protein